MSHLDDKLAAEHDESKHTSELPKFDGEGEDHHLAVQRPAILQGLSDEELAVIDQGATKKLDILLMPTLVALYIL